MGLGCGDGAGDGLFGGASVLDGGAGPGGPELGVEDGGGGPSAGGVEDVEFDPGDGAPGCTVDGGCPPGPC